MWDLRPLTRSVVLPPVFRVSDRLSARTSVTLLLIGSSLLSHEYLFLLFGKPQFGKRMGRRVRLYKYWFLYSAPVWHLLEINIANLLVTT